MALNLNKIYNIKIIHIKMHRTMAEYNKQDTNKWIKELTLFSNKCSHIIIMYHLLLWAMVIQIYPKDIMDNQHYKECLQIALIYNSLKFNQYTKFLINKNNLIFNSSQAPTIISSIKHKYINSLFNRLVRNIKLIDKKLYKMNNWWKFTKKVAEIYYSYKTWPSISSKSNRNKSNKWENNYSCKWWRHKEESKSKRKKLGEKKFKNIEKINNIFNYKKRDCNNKRERRMISKDSCNSKM